MTEFHKVKQFCDELKNGQCFRIIIDTEAAYRADVFFILDAHAHVETLTYSLFFRKDKSWITSESGVRKIAWSTLRNMMTTGSYIRKHENVSYEVLGGKQEFLNERKRLSLKKRKAEADIFMKTYKQVHKYKTKEDDNSFL